MKISLILFLCLLFVQIDAEAGHGFMNSFSDVEWFSDPGTLPSESSYLLDIAAEKAQLALSGSLQERVTLCVSLANEKLSEVSEVIKLNNVEAATRALRYYEDYMDYASAAVREAETAEDHTWHLTLITKQLEHVYLIGVDYVDMPLIKRKIMQRFFSAATQRYESLKAQLSADEKEALFFKEEEIRWSIDMTQQADKQEITNE